MLKSFGHCCGGGGQRICGVAKVVTAGIGAQFLQVIGVQQGRTISTSTVLTSKKNFNRFFMGNKRGTRHYKENRHLDPDYFSDIPVYTSVKVMGYRYGKKFRHVPEMMPEIVVPDLTGFNLKPYVSYKAAEIVEPEFTAKDLFYYVYEKKIEKDFKEGDLDENGTPRHPSPQESQTPDEAFIKARQTGCDIFSERIPKRWECLYDESQDQLAPLKKIC